MELAGWQIGGLFVAGLAAGFVDAVAGGGGLITVPALLWVGLPPHLALGTNKLQSACGTSLAVWRYSRAGLLHWREVWLTVGLTFLASVGGTLAVTRVDATLLRGVIPWLLLAVGLYTLGSPRLGAESRQPRLPPLAFAWLCSLVLGFYDGFFGPGTGSFWAVAYVLLLGLDLRRATAHTKAANLASNLGSLAVFLPARQAQLGIALVMISGQLIGAWLGAHLVIARGAKFIRLVFLATVFALTIKLLWAQLAG